jgi:predicted O-methyltransferase YrrM
MMSRQVHAVVSYLKHTIHARSRYKVHSPFVYSFYDDVIMNGKNQIEYRIVNRLRMEMETASRFIKRKDMGARCRDYPCDQRFVRVKDVVHHSSVNRHKGEFLFRLSRNIQAMNILELGTSMGISTMYLGLSAPAGRVITIEGCIDSANLARENFDKAGLKNITIITGNFDEKLTVALDSMPRPDLVFFDGNHKKEPTLAYFQQCLQHIHPGTVFVFDDIHWSSGMEAAWRTICRHPDVKVTIDLYHMGIVFFREELSKENFTLHF